MHNRCIYPVPCTLGLPHHVLTCPGTGPSMQFLFVGSHLCSRASFGPLLVESPLPSASGYVSISSTPTGDSHPIRSCPCRAYTFVPADCLRQPLNSNVELNRFAVVVLGRKWAECDDSNTVCVKRSSSLSVRLPGCTLCRDVRCGAQLRWSVTMPMNGASTSAEVPNTHDLGNASRRGLSCPSRAQLAARGRFIR